MEEKDQKQLLKERDKLSLKLGYLQRVMKDYNVPVMILFEGVHASGKGRLANELLISLDPRYTKFYATHTPTEVERRKPFLWQYFTHTPSHQEFTIFYRSWYSLYSAIKNNPALYDAYEDPEVLLEEMQSFEKTLVDDGTELLKFYVHIDEDKQKANIQRMYDNPRTMWKAQEYDRDNDASYKKEIESLLEKEEDSWAHIHYKNRFETVNEVMSLVVERLEKRVKKEKKRVEEGKENNDGFFDGSFKNILKDHDEEEELSKSAYNEKLDKLQKEVRDIQYTLYEKKIPLILVYEGWDAAGKGGNIKRVVRQLDPTGYEINTTAAPTDLELKHHYLWRFWRQVPKTGHISIYDRSWYGRVMVERVEGFATNKDVRRAYGEINDFEKSLTNFGAIVIKFFIHISKEEQLKRFEARQEDEDKVWKITDEDWRNREKWSAYEEAINDMLDKTSTEYAPWTVINGNNKRFARIEALETIIKVCTERFFDKRFTDS
ncbi:MAG TPA: phosphate--AMP phosphotransferase [Clostridiaceae bacterium]|nr:phosphate--AMP phosphotransferase [Clostridiaceae bacterium]